MLNKIGIEIPQWCMRLLGLLIFFFGALNPEVYGQEYQENDSLTVEIKTPANDAEPPAQPGQTETKPQKQGFRCSFLILNNLAKAAEFIEEREAFDCLDSMLGLQFNPEVLQNDFVEVIGKTTQSAAIVVATLDTENASSPFEMREFAAF